jgi:hypothetical protein
MGNQSLTFCVVSVQLLERGFHGKKAEGEKPKGTGQGVLSDYFIGWPVITAAYCVN